MDGVMPRPTIPVAAGTAETVVSLHVSMELTSVEHGQATVA